MQINQATKELTFDIVHLFSGSGAGALGFQMSDKEFKGFNGKFHTVLGIDNDPYCCQDFTKLTGAPAFCIDLFSKEQYIDFHGCEQGPEWHEITPQEFRKLILTHNSGRIPDGFFLSPPCKGFSGLLPEEASKSKKYQALNGLVVRAMWLIMEAFKDDPVAFIMIENVPRITSRGAVLLNQVKGYLRQFKYQFHEGTHDCGELGGLGQVRKRYLMIARNPNKIPSFIYQPPKLKHKSIGDILGSLPMPGDIEKAGKMHRIPNLQWKTWERLALIPAGQDWRALNNLNYSPRAGSYRIVPWEATSPTVTAATKGPGISNGVSAVADPRLEFVQGYGNKYRVVKDEEPCTTVTGSRLGSGAPIYADPKVPEYSNLCKVADWVEPGPTVTGGVGVTNGALSVNDPRVKCNPRTGSYGVQNWEDTAVTVTGSMDMHNFPAAVNDPRIKCESRPKLLGVADWDKPSSVITGSMSVSSSNATAAVSDPRLPKRDKRYPGLYKVIKWENSSPTVIGQTDIQSGALNVQDPRMNCKPRSGTFGVQEWEKPGKTIIASGDVHAGAAAVADPRIPEPSDKGVFVIIAEDGTWHRPITTFEMAMLQSLPPTFPDGSPLVLAGNSDAMWREHIGNMVPPKSACAMGNSLLNTLMPNYLGEWHWGFDDMKIWVSNKISEIRGYFQ